MFHFFQLLFLEEKVDLFLQDDIKWSALHWPNSAGLTHFLSRFGVETHSTVVRMYGPYRTRKSSRTGDAFKLSLGRLALKKIEWYSHS
jgi:hypothetical protein